MKMIFIKKLTPELSEIVGLLCAEGCYVLKRYSYYGKDRGKIRLFKNHKSERIEFYNKDNKLLTHMQQLLFAEFKYHCTITTGHKINIGTITIIKTILYYTPLGHQAWQVPKQVCNGNQKIKIAFIRGYFDGDGTVSGRIRIFSTNKDGLTTVSKLIDELKIKHTMPNPILRINRKPCYYIQISEKERKRFLNIIKPISKIE